MGTSNGTSAPNGDESASGTRTDESAGSVRTDESAVLSRRGLLRTAVPIGAALVVGETLAPRDAEAAAGNPLIMGQFNDSGTSQTQLTAATGSIAAVNLFNTSTASGQGSALYARGGPASGLASDGAVIGDSHDLPGVVGASNTKAGVSGTSGSGNGVTASGGAYGVVASGGNAGVYGAGTIYGLAASGLSAQLWLVPNTNPGPPAPSGTHNQGEVYMDSAGVQWLCTASSTSSTPAVWGSVLLGGHVNSPTGQTNLTAATGTVAALNVTNTSTGSGDGTGLYVLGGASSAFPSAAAVIGDSHDLVGVAGTSWLNNGVSGQSHSNAGVSGASVNGTGVYGGSISGPGVFGATAGNGQPAVSGDDTSSGGGYGVLAASANGKALQVNGVAAFSRSGLATIAGTSTSPLSSVTVTGVALTAASMVLATPQTHSGKVAVAAVVTHPTTSSFTLYLTANVTVSFNVAWFVIG